MSRNTTDNMTSSAAPTRELSPIEMRQAAGGGSGGTHFPVKVKHNV